MTDTILELQNLHYSYEGHPEALAGVSLRFGEGERVALLGNNGAGKSTLFLNCNGVLHPQSGQRLLGGCPIGHKKADLLELRRQVGIVFQDPDRQFVAATVEEEVSFGPMNLGLPEAEVATRVDETLALMGLEDYRQRAPHTLSGGEKKLVSVADVLAMRPRLVLMDEPTAGLDPQNVVALRGVLHTLAQQNIALVVATHDVDFAWRWASRAVVMHRGAVLYDGRPAAAFADKALLQKAGLRPPALFAVVEQLAAAGLWPAGAAVPKTVDEIQKILAGC